MPGVYTVTQINNYIKNLFARDFVLNRISVRGEVSNCKYHSSGHIYFTLKDDGGALNCVMFAAQRQELTFRLADGQQIEAYGQIGLYEKSGTYQLYVRKCTLAGEGILYERFLRLKAELEEMGMFDALYKKPIPAYCRRVGIVTSPTGAAVQDIINISRRRNPYVELVLCPAKVQGQGAAESIVRGIRRLDMMGLDVLIVGRGGGSIEDLWAFNERTVAEAIFEAETPVISAVGHETDFTIADFVADLRAPTPSAAAELANFEYEDLMQQLDAERTFLRRALEYKLGRLRAELASRQERLKRLSPSAALELRRHRLDEYQRRMEHCLELKTERLKAQFFTRSATLTDTIEKKTSASRRTLELCAARLDGLSPLKRLGGGYGYLTDGRGRALSSAASVQVGDALTVRLRDGKISGQVTAVERI